MTSFALYKHQEQAIEQLYEALMSRKKRPILMAPTGFGKTVVMVHIVKRALAKGKRVVIVVPAISLIDQTVASLHRNGITEVGVIQSDHPLTDWSKSVQVASIQTIGRKRYPEADLVLVDECHKLFKTQVDWMKHPDWLKVPFIGLSATPWSKGLGKLYDHLIIASSTQELIDGKFLSPFRVYAPSHPDLSGVKTVAGDYHEGDLADVMNKPVLVANVVETWIRQGEGRPTLCFAVDCAHAKHLQRQFEEAGIPCGYIDAHTDMSDRNIVRDKFKRGEYKVVCNVGTLTTGVDWDVRCIILARPTKSEILFTQIIGRGLRTAPGKADCLILDHSDTHSRLGFVTDIHHDTLDTGKATSKQAEKKVRLPKECSKCHYLRPVGVRACPACGHIAELPPGPECEDGQLSEVIRSSSTNERGPKNTIRLKEKWIPYVEFYGQLKQYESDHKYRSGWADNQYRDFVGTWPNAYRYAPKRPVSPEVLSWIKSRQIAYAKRREQQGAAHV
ncbi:MAG: DEAD/DEAH box helicase [Rhodospirillaceae bacterium]